MGIRILTGHEQGYTPTDPLILDRACLFDSVSEWAFGPVFYADDSIDGGTAEQCAQWFLDWATEQAGTDLRRLTDAEMEGLYVTWQKNRQAA